MSKVCLLKHFPTKNTASCQKHWLTLTVNRELSPNSGEEVFKLTEQEA